MGIIKELPAIVVKDIVLMPHMSVNFSLLTKEAAHACEKAMKGDQLVFVAFQKFEQSYVSKENLYEIGMVTKIKQINKLPDKNVQLILEKLNGGGYFDAAGAQMKNVSLKDAMTLLKKAIDDFADEK